MDIRDVSRRVGIAAAVATVIVLGAPYAIITGPEYASQLADYYASGAVGGAGVALFALLSAVVMLGSVVLPTQSAGNMSSLFFLLSFIIVNVAVIRLRRKRPNMNRPYEIPYYPIPPILAIALNGILAVVLIGFLIQTDVLALLLSAGWLAAGAVMYVVLNKYRAGGTAGEGTEPATDQPAAGGAEED